MNLLSRLHDRRASLAARLRRRVRHAGHAPDLGLVLSELVLFVTISALEARRR
jgi:hypothetical protein